MRTINFTKENKIKYVPSAPALAKMLEYCQQMGIFNEYTEVSPAESVDDFIERFDALFKRTISEEDKEEEDFAEEDKTHQSCRYLQQTQHHLSRSSGEKIQKQKLQK